MENNEKKQGLSLDQGSQISVMVNNAYEEDDSIDLGKVFQNFKKRTPVFIWLVLFGLLLGVGAGVLKGWMDRKPLTVSSVVTLDYSIPVDSTDPSEETRYVPVTNLSDPEGNPLDLNQVTSSFVLQNAMKDLNLSQPVSLANLRANLRVDRILTEESRRNQEMASRMLDQNNLGTAAYEQAQEVKLEYVNRFIVSLTNGFGDEDSGDVRMLEDGELRTLLDRILASYNDYLVLTYADKKLPDDEIGVIDIQNQDLLESLDLLRTATRNLITYCDEKPETVRTYRSWQTGYTLDNLETRLNLVRDVNVDYLYSYVYANSIARNVNTVLTNFRYQLREARNRMDTLTEKIETTRKVLEGYKNDEIFVSMQESDTSKSTRTTTDYYNELILEQAKNYEEAATLEITVSDLENKIANLEAGTSRLDSLLAQQELKESIGVSHGVYQEIVSHMTEVFDSAVYNNFARASVAQGKTVNLLTASMKNMLVYGAVGAVIALGLWFGSALAPEFMGRKKEEEAKKE